MEENTGKIWDKHWSTIDSLETFLAVEKSTDKWTICHRPIIDRLLGELPQGGVFLEAGSGFGQWCFYAQRKYGAKAVGVDIAKATIEKMQKYVREKQIEGVEFIFDDLTDTKLPANFCDFFISLGVIEHFEDSDPIMRGMQKTLKSRGKGLITVPNSYSFHTFLRPIAKLLGKWTIGYEKSFSPSGLKKICEKNGFRVLECGVIPSGEMFGLFLNNLPIIGRIVERLSYWIEKNQKTLGFIAYVVVENQEQG